MKRTIFAGSKRLSAVILLLYALVYSSSVAYCQTALPAFINTYNYTGTKNITGKKSAVVCAHPLAAQVGAYILKEGGNAVDAAIATQLALAVVYPRAGNIGGGGFMILRTNKGKTTTLDFRETAPAGASPNMYVDANGKANTDLSQNGQLAAGIPGTVAGLFASMKYARLPFRQLISPAIELAEKGFCITGKEATLLNDNREDFVKNNKSTTVFSRASPWKEGDTLVQKELANTLRRIRDKGVKGFYEGETARLIVAEMKRGNGIITLNDLKNYKPKERTPLEVDYRGYHIITMPPPSSGGVLLAQMLGMLEKYPLKNYGYGSRKAVQLMIEAERRAFADRAEHLGDPDFYLVPAKTLLSKNYLQSRMRDYDSLHASSSTIIKAGNIRESEETTHLSIADAAGNCVSLTTTLNGNYGSHTVVAGAGFILNNEMDDFSVQPGVPNMYGAVGGKANAVAPGKRMLSSMTPTIVVKKNKPWMIVGTPGGTTIITSVLQSIVNTIDFEMNAANAVNKPKFHHQWLPDLVYVEKDFPAATMEQLQGMGYTIKQREPIGRTEMIRWINGKIEAAADERGDDSAEGE